MDGDQKEFCSTVLVPVKYCILTAQRRFFQAFARREGVFINVAGRSAARELAPERVGVCLKTYLNRQVLSFSRPRPHITRGFC